MQLQRSDCYQSKGLGGGGEFSDEERETADCATAALNW